MPRGVPRHGAGRPFAVQVRGCQAFTRTSLRSLAAVAAVSSIEPPLPLARSAKPKDVTTATVLWSPQMHIGILMVFAAPALELDELVLSIWAIWHFMMPFLKPAGETFSGLPIILPLPL